MAERSGRPTLQNLFDLIAPSHSLGVPIELAASKIAELLIRHHPEQKVLPPAERDFVREARTCELKTMLNYIDRSYSGVLDFAGFARCFAQQGSANEPDIEQDDAGIALMRARRVISRHLPPSICACT